MQAWETAALWGASAGGHLRRCRSSTMSPHRLRRGALHLPTRRSRQDANLFLREPYGEDPTRFHLHLHSLVTDGLVLPEGSFLPLSCPDPVQIMRLFRHKLLDTLLAQDKITPRLVEILLSWRHPGFSVYQGEPIAPDDHETRQRLARYMVHPPVALDRLRYHPETAQVAYYARNHDRSGAPDASVAHIVPALDFLAARQGA